MARVAFLLPDFRIGGAERVALSLIEEFVKRGIEIDLVLLRAEGDLLKLLPAAVKVVSLNAARIRNAIRPFAAYLRERRPDAVQASMWPITLVAILGRMLARSRSRLVLSDHSNVSVQFRDQPMRLKVIGWSMRLLYPSADVRVCVSQDVAVDLAAISGLRPTAFEVVYNPIEQRTGVATPAAEAQWQGSGRKILTVGTLKWQKNHVLLLHAFAILRRRAQARLMIVGEGPLRKVLEKKVAELEIGDAVSMPGFVLDPTPYYATADLFALSSDYEGFANVLVEAMASGLPVVSTDCRSGPREVLADGEFGRLVPVGDAQALASALEQELEEQHEVPRLRARANEFRPEVAADRYLALMLGEGH